MAANQAANTYSPKPKEKQMESKDAEGRRNFERAIFLENLELFFEFVGRGIFEPPTEAQRHELYGIALKYGKEELEDVVDMYSQAMTLRGFLSAGYLESHKMAQEAWKN